MHPEILKCAVEDRPPKPHKKHQWGACCLTTLIKLPMLQGMAVKAGSVLLIFLKFGWKCSLNILKARLEGAWPHPQQHHPVPQGSPFPTKCWLATGSTQSHKNHTRPHGPSATLPTQELTSFPVWVEHHHFLTTTCLCCFSSGPIVCTNTVV